MTKATGIDQHAEAAGDAPFAGIKARFRVQEADNLVYISSPSYSRRRHFEAGERGVMH